MIRKSGNRFSEKIMLNQKCQSEIASSEAIFALSRVALPEEAQPRKSDCRRQED